MLIVLSAHIRGQNRNSSLCSTRRIIKGQNGKQTGALSAVWSRDALRNKRNEKKGGGKSHFTWF